MLLIFAGCTLDYRKDIDDFVGCNHDLRALELTEEEWAAISQVADWLKAFHSTTTQMSMTKHSMLSSMHVVFRGLQEHICMIYSNLPLSMPRRMKMGLLGAHQKLSEYYYRFDESPFYTWATCKSFVNFIVWYC